jgi:hypothetical protein
MKNLDRSPFPPMHANQKLTHVIAGRTVEAVARSGAVTTVLFADGSQMTVRGPANRGTSSAIPAPKGRVESARQDQSTLRLVFDSGAVLDLDTAEPSSTVMVRDNAHVMQYAD